MGLYGVCGIVAACFVAAIALYSHEATSPSAQPVALVAVADAPKQTATPRAAPARVVTPSGASPENLASGPASAGQPSVDTATSLFAGASAFSTPAPEPAPSPAALPEAVAPPSGIASTPPANPALIPAPPAPTAEPAPDPEAPAAASAPSGFASATDIAAAASSAQPIWAMERKPSRKLAKATPGARRNEPAAANVAATRNDGYAALQQRRYRDALILLQQATMMGDRDAPMYLGQIFENGTGVARNVGQASYWYGIAINRGNGAALAAFNRMRVNPY